MDEIVQQEPTPKQRKIVPDAEFCIAWQKAVAHKRLQTNLICKKPL